MLSATLTKGLHELAGSSLERYTTIAASSKGFEITEYGEMPTRMTGDAEAEQGSGVTTTPAACVTTGPCQTDEALDAPMGLNQSYAFVPTRQKLTALLALIRSKSTNKSGKADVACKMVVFLSSCDGVDFLYEVCVQRATRAATAHTHSCMPPPFLE